MSNPFPIHSGFIQLFNAMLYFFNLIEARLCHTAIVMTVVRATGTMIMFVTAVLRYV